MIVSPTFMSRTSRIPQTIAPTSPLEIPPPSPTVEAEPAERRDDPLEESDNSGRKPTTGWAALPTAAAALIVTNTTVAPLYTQALRAALPAAPLPRPHRQGPSLWRELEDRLPLGCRGRARQTRERGGLQPFISSSLNDRPLSRGAASASCASFAIIKI